MDAPVPARPVRVRAGLLSATPPSRRGFIGGAVGLALAGPARGAAETVAEVRVSDGPATPISPFVYGSNEIGTMDGGRPSAELDLLAGVTARRLGGNLMTTHNWWGLFSNAGKDDRNANGDYLPGVLGIRGAGRRPGAVIERMHRASLGMGAISLVTLPLAGSVAADAVGVVAAADHAPSRRFVPVRWRSDATAGQPIDRGIADVPHLLRRLQRRFGGATGSTGIRGYILDNEPGLWAQTHPRVVQRPVAIADLLARSIAAATVIKAIDPAAWVIGPAAWGATEMATLQNAPDWPAYRHYDSFLAAYLDAFRAASAVAGHRLLDALDVHWYPFSRRGPLFRSEDPTMAAALLDAPRSLTEAGFREDSWVSEALPVATTGGLALPLLPSLARLTDRWFPGTRVTVTEFNYGGAGQLASGLAVADALGRFGQAGALVATHWGSLDGWLGQAYRLYRDYDGRGARFGNLSLPVAVSDPAGLSGFAARGAGDLHVILINKGTGSRAVDLILDAAQPGLVTAYGFDADRPATGMIAPRKARSGRVERLVLPPRAARHLLIEG